MLITGAKPAIDIKPKSKSPHSPVPKSSTCVKRHMIRSQDETSLTPEQGDADTNLKPKTQDTTCSDNALCTEPEVEDVDTVQESLDEIRDTVTMLEAERYEEEEDTSDDEDIVIIHDPKRIETFQQQLVFSIKKAPLETIFSADIGDSDEEDGHIPQTTVDPKDSVDSCEQTDTRNFTSDCSKDDVEEQNISNSSASYDNTSCLKEKSNVSVDAMMATNDINNIITEMSLLDKYTQDSNVEKHSDVCADGVKGLDDSVVKQVVTGTALANDSDEEQVRSAPANDCDDDQLATALANDSDEEQVRSAPANDCDDDQLSTALANDSDEEQVANDNVEERVATSLANDSNEERVATALANISYEQQVVTALANDSDEDQLATALSNDSDEERVANALVNISYEDQVSTALANDSDEDQLATALANDSDEEQVATALANISYEEQVATALANDSDGESLEISVSNSTVVVPECECLTQITNKTHTSTASVFNAPSMPCLKDNRSNGRKESDEPFDSTGQQYSEYDPERSISESYQDDRVMSCIVHMDCSDIVDDLTENFDDSSVFLDNEHDISSLTDLQVDDINEDLNSDDSNTSDLDQKLRNSYEYVQLPQAENEYRNTLQHTEETIDTIPSQEGILHVQTSIKGEKSDDLRLEAVFKEHNLDGGETNEKENVKEIDFKEQQTFLLDQQQNDIQVQRDVQLNSEQKNMLVEEALGADQRLENERMLENTHILEGVPTCRLENKCMIDEQCKLNRDGSLKEECELENRRELELGTPPEDTNAQIDEKRIQKEITVGNDYHILTSGQTIDEQGQCKKTLRSLSKTEEKLFLDLEKQQKLGTTEIKPIIEKEGQTQVKSHDFELQEKRISKTQSVSQQNPKGANTTKDAIVSSEYSVDAVMKEMEEFDRAHPRDTSLPRIQKRKKRHGKRR